MGSAIVWGLSIGLLLTCVTGGLSYLYLRHLRTLVRAHMYLGLLMQGETPQQANAAVSTLPFQQVAAYQEVQEAFAYIMSQGLAADMLEAARSEGFNG